MNQYNSNERTELNHDNTGKNQINSKHTNGKQDISLRTTQNFHSLFSNENQRRIQTLNTQPQEDLQQYSQQQSPTSGANVKTRINFVQQMINNSSHNNNNSANSKIKVERINSSSQRDLDQTNENSVLNGTNNHNNNSSHTKSSGHNYNNNESVVPLAQSINKNNLHQIPHNGIGSPKGLQNNFFVNNANNSNNMNQNININVINKNKMQNFPLSVHNSNARQVYTQISFENDREVQSIGVQSTQSGSGQSRQMAFSKYDGFINANNIQNREVTMNNSIEQSTSQERDTNQNNVSMSRRLKTLQTENISYLMPAPPSDFKKGILRNQTKRSAQQQFSVKNIINEPQSTPNVSNFNPSFHSPSNNGLYIPSYTNQKLSSDRNNSSSNNNNNNNNFPKVSSTSLTSKRQLLQNFGNTPQTSSQQVSTSLHHPNSTQSSSRSTHLNNYFDSNNRRTKQPKNHSNHISQYYYSETNQSNFSTIQEERHYQIKNQGNGNNNPNHSNIIKNLDNLVLDEIDNQKAKNLQQGTTADERDFTKTLLDFRQQLKQTGRPKVNGAADNSSLNISVKKNQSFHQGLSNGTNPQNEQMMTEPSQGKPISNMKKNSTNVRVQTTIDQDQEEIEIGNNQYKNYETEGCETLCTEIINDIPVAPKLSNYITRVSRNDMPFSSNNNTTTAVSNSNTNTDVRAKQNNYSFAFPQNNTTTPANIRQNQYSFDQKFQLSNNNNANNQPSSLKSKINPSQSEIQGLNSGQLKKKNNTTSGIIQSNLKDEFLQGKLSSFSYYNYNMEMAYRFPANEDYFNQLYREHFIQSFHALYFCKMLRPFDPFMIEQKQVYLKRKDPSKQKKCESFFSLSERTIIFDLDETLIHCNENSDLESDVVLPICFPNGDMIEAGINIRPYAVECLAQVSKLFEVIIFTASHSCYATQVLDYLDPENKYISHRLFRENCITTDEGVHVQDLRIFGDRSLKDIVLVDNAAYSFGMQLDNGIPIIPYYDNKKDMELKMLIDYLKNFIACNDVRETNRKNFRMHLYSEYNTPELALEKIYGIKMKSNYLDF